MGLRNIQEMHYDQVEAVGVVRRIYFYCLIAYQDGSKEWHYFGTKPVDKPPTTGDPVFEHPYVQFPQDTDDLDPEYHFLLYDLAQIIGFKREGFE